MSVSRVARVGYASGNLGKSLFWTSLEYLLLFYMTDLVGLSPAWAGVIIVVSLVWDGVTDPLMGYWVDRRSSRGHDYRPYLRWGPPLCGLAYATIFYVPFEGEFAKALYLLAANLLFRSIYTLLDVPHNALLAKMPMSSRQRTTVSAWRYFFSSIGGLSVALAVAPLLGRQAESGDTTAFLIFALAAGLIACATLWQSIPIAREVSAKSVQKERALAPIEFLRSVAVFACGNRFLCPSGDQRSDIAPVRPHGPVSGQIRPRRSKLGQPAISRFHGGPDPRNADLDICWAETG